MDEEQLSRYYRIARWIAEDIAETILPEEKDKLEQWLQQDPLHPQIYSHIAKRLKNGEEPKSYRYTPSVKADWKKVETQLDRRQDRKKRSMFYYRCAAVAVLLVGVGFALFQLKTRTSAVIGTTLTEQTSIQAGSSKAVLTLASGEKVVLEETTTDSIQVDGTIIEKKVGGLAYQQTEENAGAQQEVFNVISIPYGGEYKLTLADGTRVWMNSASELKYPVKFIGDKRMVYIKGEAYFEVAGNPEKPFIVKTSHNMEVKVLGTHFNISAYDEEATIATTLAEGKVTVSDGISTVDLIPDQQAVFEKASKNITCREVDASQYIAWKDGKFIFEDESLENIMERVSRWYNVQVFFKGNAIRQLRFSGDLEKYDDFSTVIRMLEKVSRIRVQIKDKAVFIEET